MCEPTVIMMGLSLAASAAQMVQANKNANSQQEALDKAGVAEQLDLTRMLDQQHAAGTQQMNEAAKQGAKESALFDVVAGEFGGGATASRTGAINASTNSSNLATIQQNVQTGASETGFRSATALANTNARTASVGRVSNTGALLTLGGQAAGMYLQTKKPT